MTSRQRLNLSVTARFVKDLISRHGRDLDAHAALTAVALTDPTASGDLTGFGGAWTAYTPTFEAASGTPNVDAANGGILAGYYMQIGKTVFFRIEMKFGSVSPNAGTGNWRFGLPVPHRTVSTNFALNASGYMEDAAVAGYGITVVRLYSGDQSKIELLRTSATTGGVSVVGATNPFAWNVNDFLTIAGSYEAA